MQPTHMHSVRLRAEEAGPDNPRGHLIGRTKVELNTKLRTFTDDKGRPLTCVDDRTAGQRLRSNRLPSQQFACCRVDELELGYDADWFRHS